MPSLYPSTNKLKIVELSGELTALNDNLKLMPEFYNKDELLRETAVLLQDKENIQYADLMMQKNKIINISRLMDFIQERLIQLDILKDLIKKYCSKNELPDQIHLQEKELKKEITQYPIDSKEIKSRLIQINSISNVICENLFKSITQLLEQSDHYEYKKYFNNRLDLFAQLEKIRSNSLMNNETNLDTVRYIIGSIREFEQIHQLFLSFTENFSRKYGELIPNLLNFENIHFYKKEFEQQIEILCDKFRSFESSPKLIENLNHHLSNLYEKLNEFHDLNDAQCKELQKQRKELILLVIISEKKLRNHTIKLSKSTTKLAKVKNERIKEIRDKINLLVNYKENFQANFSVDNIDELIKIIEDARAVLSEYRGIPLLRCFATFWGGGKVTSVPLVDELEEQLILLQKNIHNLSPKIKSC